MAELYVTTDLIARLRAMVTERYLPNRGALLCPLGAEVCRQAGNISA